jgi:CheY-like chemotaxis protein
MPKVDGWTVLSEMQRDESLCDIPIAVFSTSSRAEDRRRAHALGARTFVVKPQSFDKLIEEIRSLSAQFLQPELKPL